MITSGRQLAAQLAFSPGSIESELATLANLHRNSIGRWEQCKAIPTGHDRPFAVCEMLKGLAKAGVTIRFF